MTLAPVGAGAPAQDWTGYPGADHCQPPGARGCSAGVGACLPNRTEVVAAPTDSRPIGGWLHFGSHFWSPPLSRLACVRRLELFTDGACSGNPGPGAWAFILRGDGIEGEVAQAGFEAATTNNRMELMGIIRGLESVPEAPSHVRVTSDSEYAVKGLREWLDGWKKRNWKNSRREPVKNDDLWKRLDALRERHRLDLAWVRGHQDHPENNRCDQMAVREIERNVQRR